MHFVAKILAIKHGIDGISLDVQGGSIARSLLSFKPRFFQNEPGSTTHVFIQNSVSA